MLKMVFWLFLTASKRTFFAMQHGQVHFFAKLYIWKQMKNEGKYAKLME